MEWDEDCLENLTVKIGSGATPHGGETNYKTSGISLIRSQNVYDFEFRSEGLAFIDEEQASALANVEVHPKDILLNITGDSVGRCCMVPDSILPARVNQHVSIIRTRTERLDPKFLLYYINEPRNKAALLQVVHGATRRALTKGIIQSYKVRFPSLPIQRRIAEILGALDDKIECNCRINQTLEQMAMALYKHWFVDFGPFRSGEFADSELGRIPKGWEVVTLGEMCDLLMGQSPPSEFYNELGEGLPFHQGVTNFDWRFPKHVIYCTELARIAEAGSILFSVRAPVGRINIADQRIVIGRGIASINHERSWNSFLFYQLRTIFTEEDTIGSGTIFNAVTKTDLENIKVIRPPDDLVQKFNAIVSNYDKQIEVNENESKILVRMRDYLLPKLLSGEIEVKAAEDAVEDLI